MDTEEEFDAFPFNMSDFVTLDEVGDVADLPLPPSPTTAMETSQEAPPTAAEHDAQMVIILKNAPPRNNSVRNITVRCSAFRWSVSRQTL